MIWHDIYEPPRNWVNKFYNIYIAALVGTISRVALELRCVTGTNLISTSNHCISLSLHFSSQSNKMECSNYKSGCGVMCIEAFNHQARNSTMNIEPFKKH